MIKKNTIDIPCRCLTSHKDPTIKNITHYRWYTPIQDIPEGVSQRPNVRIQHTKSKVYKEIKKAQLNDGLDEKHHNLYHLGSGGITLVAKNLSVIENAGGMRVQVDNRKIDGIVNGGHQYASALENKDKIIQMIKDGEDVNQLIPFHAIVGMVPEKISYIAKALNTNVQVKLEAILYNDGSFKSVEQVLKKAEILQHFGRLGNEKRVKKLPYNMGDCAVLMEAFNRHQFPDGHSHGTICASNRQKVIENYGKVRTRRQFSGMVHLLPELWILYETVSHSGWDKLGLSEPADSVTWVHGPHLYQGNVLRAKGSEKVYNFPIIKKQGNTKLSHALVLCIMSAFRQFLQFSGARNHYSWKRTFPEVLAIWDKAGKELISLADEKTRQMDRNSSGVLKTDTSGVWTEMYRQLSKY